MSRAQRLGLIAAAVAAAAVAFVAVRPGEGDDEPSSPTAETAPRAPSAGRREPTATADAPSEHRIRLRGHEPSGRQRRIEVRKGELVRLVVESDVPDEIHLHGYDITRGARPRDPARFQFRADVEGVFELESHTAEHGGGDATIARVVVEPS